MLQLKRFTVFLLAISMFLANCESRSSASPRVDSVNEVLEVSAENLTYDHWGTLTITINPPLSGNGMLVISAAPPSLIQLSQTGIPVTLEEGQQQTVETSIRLLQPGSVMVSVLLNLNNSIYTGGLRLGISDDGSEPELPVQAVDEGISFSPFQ